MPVSCLLISEGDTQQYFLTERLAHDLHTYRQAVSEASRYGDSRDSSNVYG